MDETDRRKEEADDEGNDILATELPTRASSSQRSLGETDNLHP